MTAGVIFDCDGVLVDTEPVSNRVLAEQLTAAGVPTTPAESIERYLGGSSGQMLAHAEGVLGRPLPGDFIAGYERRMFEAFQQELRPIPGVTEAIDAIDLPRCVASSGSHEKIRLTLGLTGLLPRFEERIFSAQDVPNGKPAPDLFLHAARSMGFDPARTVVVEDSERGVQAAVAAGMTVLAYCDHTPAERLEAAGGRVFEDMRELPALVVDSPG